MTDSGGESSSAKVGDFGEHGVSSEPIDKAAGAGDGSHSSKESVTSSEPGSRREGHGKKPSSPDVEGEKGDGCGVSKKE